MKLFDRNSAIRPDRRMALATLPALIAAGSSMLSPGASAQAAFPAKVVTLIHPFPPGGTGDLITRLVQPKLQERLGVPVVVENRPGASGDIGTAFVSMAAPDGHTLLVTPDAFVVNAIAKKESMDEMLRRVTPVGSIVRHTLVFAGPASLPASDLKSFIAYVQANPGKVNFGSVGVGTSTYLGIAYLMNTAGIQMTHVPYGTPAALIQALVVGDIHMFVADVRLMLGFKDKLKALALTGSKRAPLLPGIQTVAESGFPGFEFSYYLNVFAPSGTPTPIVERLNFELRAVMADPSIVERLNAMGYEAAPSTPTEIALFLRGEHARWTELVKARNVKFDG